jgi:glyoxylase-like metal-dependent hydrolase (beta-lactamase superfamily II)
LIIKALVVGPLASNCYIVASEDREGIIIDPGADATEIMKEVIKLKLEIKYIVLTHGHIDHIGALKEIKEATSAKIAVHTEDVDSLQKQSLIAEQFGISFQDPPSADLLLKDGDIINIGTEYFSVLHTPGHSPGSICLYGEGILFSGDTLFNFGIGRYDLPGGDYYQLINGISSKLMVLPDETSVYPGHGPATTIGTERKSNPFLNS